MAQILYGYPDTQFVAEFIGSPAMNTVPVTLDEADGDVVAVHDGFELSLPTPDLFTDRPDSGTFGVRPEDISLVRNVGDAAQTFEAEVSVTEPLGESLLLHCNLGGDDIQVKAAPRSTIEPGDRVELTVDEDRLHVFDPVGDAVNHSSPRGAASEERVNTPEA
ncbi:TOBE domain-containing protein [Halobellus sp. EA9]|uniref:TOBE domain-containing protein n=1 Tax=Halobellus sp. EA9 TaxID=3421647 RepID=UPI003EB74AB3